jgi:Rrf2 family protein
MRLSKKAQYGTRAILEMALHYDRGVVSLSHISREHGISLKYLEQLVRPLRKAGIVQGLRGAAGGYRLSRAPSEIRVGDVIQALDERINPVQCLDDLRYCDRTEECRARGIWVALSESIHSALNGITLQEIIQHGELEELGRSKPLRANR